MDVLRVKSNNVENAFLEIHCLLWATSCLGRNKIESSKVRATRLISVQRNTPIYLVSKAYKKSGGERDTHSNNRDEVFFLLPSPPQLLSSKFPSHLSCFSLARLLFPRAVKI